MVHNGDPIKLGCDFRLKVEAGPKKFDFWLNAESIKHRDLKDTYEDERYHLHDGISDNTLYQIILPKGVEGVIDKDSKDGQGPSPMVRLPALR
jgi:hypothetical protein